MQLPSLIDLFAKVPKDGAAAVADIELPGTDELPADAPIFSIDLADVKVPSPQVQIASEKVEPAKNIARDLTALNWRLPEKAAVIEEPEAPFSLVGEDALPASKASSAQTDAPISVSAVGAEVVPRRGRLEKPPDSNDSAPIKLPIRQSLGEQKSSRPSLPDFPDATNRTEKALGDGRKEQVVPGRAAPQPMKAVVSPEDNTHTIVRQTPVETDQPNKSVRQPERPVNGSVLKVTDPAARTAKVKEDPVEGPKPSQENRLQGHSICPVTTETAHSKSTKMGLAEAPVSESVSASEKRPSDTAPSDLKTPERSERTRTESSFQIPQSKASIPSPFSDPVQALKELSSVEPKHVAESFHSTDPVGLGESKRHESQSLPALVNRPEVQRAVISQLSQVSLKPDQPVELRLDPQELGQVRMVLTSQDQALTLVMSAERPETLDLMRRHIDQLARDFQELGYTDLKFSFEDSQTGSDPQNSKQPKQRAAGEFTEPETVAQVLRLGATSGLDIRL